MTLAIKEWKAIREPGDGVYVKIVGRQSGLLSWLLTVLALKKGRTTLTVQADRIFFDVTSASGSSRRIIPMDSVSSVYHCYRKPFWSSLFLFLAALFVVFACFTDYLHRQSSFWLPVLSLLGLAVGPLLYRFHRTFDLGFVETGGFSSGIVFVRSVLEGQEINEQQAARVADIIESLLPRAKRQG